MDTASKDAVPPQIATVGQATLRPGAIQSARQRHHDTCVICLSPLTERAITVPCNHTTFDFVCLASWTQSSLSSAPSSAPTCPLCKTPLTAIQYDFRSPSDFKTYHIPQPSADSSAPSSWTAAAASSPNRAAAHWRYPAPRPTPRNRGPPHRRRDPFAINPPLTPDLALDRRKRVYRDRTYSLHVGSNRVSRYGDVTPSTIRASAALQARARAWIRRELRVFSFLGPDSDSDGGGSGGSASSRSSAAARTRRRGGTFASGSNLEFVLEYIMAIVRTTDLKGSSGRAEELVAEFLGPENASLFLHELGAWLRSPFERVEDWDRVVQYGAKEVGRRQQQRMRRPWRERKEEEEGRTRGVEEEENDDSGNEAGGSGGAASKEVSSGRPRGTPQRP